MLLRGFRDGYNTQNVLSIFLQCCKNSINNKGGGALFIDHSNAFDCVNCYLQLAKVNAYDNNLDALQLIRIYLSKRHQRVRVNNTFSNWKEAFRGYQRLCFSVFYTHIY